MVVSQFFEGLLRICRRTRMIPRLLQKQGEGCYDGRIVVNNEDCTSHKYSKVGDDCVKCKASFVVQRFRRLNLHGKQAWIKPANRRDAVHERDRYEKADDVRSAADER